MAIGERIRHLRNLRGMTQKALGLLMRFPENAADVRIAQYEAGTRKPKGEAIEKLADILDVLPQALDVPNIENFLGLMHTFFALQDVYGLEPVDIDGYTHLRIGTSNGRAFFDLNPMLDAWLDVTTKYKNGEMTQEEYDQWRYRFPELNRYREPGVRYVPVPPMSEEYILAMEKYQREVEYLKKKMKKKKKK